MDRRRFLKLGTIGGAAMLGGCGEPPQQGTPNAAAATRAATPAAAQSSFTFSVNAIDGYAYLFKNDSSQLLLGGIDANGKQHKLIVRVRAGRVLSTGHELPHDAGVAGAQFDFTTYQTVVSVGGPASPIRPSGLVALPSALPCPVPANDFTTWNNLGFLPHASDVYPAAELAPDWPSKLHSCLVLDRGVIRVLPGVPGMWHFRTKKDNTEVHKQQMSDRVTIETPASGNSILFKAYPMGHQPTGDPEFTIEIAPENGLVNVDVGIAHGLPPNQIDVHPDGKPIDHYARYATLFAHKDQAHTPIADDEIVLPWLEACPGGDQTPGDFCPFIQASFP